jgi:hypothetical protein
MQTCPTQDRQVQCFWREEGGRRPGRKAMLVTQRKQSHIIAVVTVSTSGRSATSPTGALTIIKAAVAVAGPDEPSRGRQYKLASAGVGCSECRKGGQRAPNTSASAALFTGASIQGVSSTERQQVRGDLWLGSPFPGHAQNTVGVDTFRER